MTRQLPLFEPPFAAQSATSREAAERIKGHAATLRNEVFDFIRRCGAHGATTDEVEVALGLRHQTASPRVYELVNENPPRLVLTQALRKTRSGRNAGVYLAVIPQF